MTEFRWGPWFGGLLITFLAGMIANVVAILVGVQVIQQVPLGAALRGLLGAAIGMLPGVLFIMISRRQVRTGFPQGMMVGGCLVLLIGGICGSSLGWS